jgi:hypothetical protein
VTFSASEVVPRYAPATAAHRPRVVQTTRSERPR